MAASSSTSSSKLRWAAQALAFVLLVFAADQGVGALLDRMFAGVEAGDSGGHINHALNHSDVDIVVFGSSRAARHVDSAALRATLGRSVYNAGANGQRIYYARGLQALMLQREHRPGLYVLQAETRDLFDPEPQRVLALAPFTGQSEHVDAAMREADPWFHIKSWSRVYRYNGIVLGLLRNVGQQRPAEDDQFKPSNGVVDFEPLPSERFTETLGNPAPDAAIVHQYRAFLQAAQEANIPVLMFSGPRYRSGGEGPLYNQAIDIFAQLAEEYGATWVTLNEVEHPEFIDGALWRDRDHLNAAGADMLTRILANAIADAHPEMVATPE